MKVELLTIFGPSLDFGSHPEEFRAYVIQIARAQPRFPLHYTMCFLSVPIDIERALPQERMWLG